MALLKAPLRQPKTTTLQVRLEDEVRHNLDGYAEFIDANASYVTSEAPKLLFRMKSASTGRANTPTTILNNSPKERLLPGPLNKHEVPSNAIPCAQEPRLAKSAWLAPGSEFVTETTTDKIRKRES